MSNDHEWLRFVDLDKIATDEEREKLMEMMLHGDDHWIHHFKRYTLREILFFFSVYIEKVVFIRFVVGLHAHKTIPLSISRVPLSNYAFRRNTREVLIDIGIDEEGSDMIPFKKSRNAARLGAIVAMGAIRSRLRRERERDLKISPVLLAA